MKDSDIRKLPYKERLRAFANIDPESLPENEGSTGVRPMEQFGHIFGHSITLLNLGLERGEWSQTKADDQRVNFLESLAQLNLSETEKDKIKSIVAVAQADWTPENIRKLVKLENETFPGDFETRNKVRKEVLGKGIGEE